MQSLFEKLKTLVSNNLDTFVATSARSKNLLRSVSTLIGVKQVWTVYERYPNGTAEVRLNLHQASTYIYRKENVAQEFVLGVHVLCWDDSDLEAFFSMDRGSRLVEKGFSEEGVSNWIVGEVTNALNRAAREMESGRD